MRSSVLALAAAVLFFLNYEDTQRAVHRALDAMTV
jgi:hypothetical protein